MLVRCMFALVVLYGLSQPARSEDSFALIESENNHGFLSVPGSTVRPHSIYYEICNLSPQNSGFHWKLAGFGVGFPSHIGPNLCARKTLWGFSMKAKRASRVAFQDNTSATVETWVACDR